MNAPVDPYRSPRAGDASPTDREPPLEFVKEKRSRKTGRKKKPANVGCIIAVVALGLFMMMLMFLLLVASMFPGAGGGGGPMAMREEVIEAGEPFGQEGKIVVISLFGAIMGNGSPSAGTETVEDLGKQLRAARLDDDVDAVLLQVDSPGGGLSATDTLHNEIQLLKREGKKVVVYVPGMAASGGYWIASPADRIVMAPTAQVGSFGVIQFHMQVQGLMKRLGVEVDPIKSTGSKDIGSIFREMTPAERKYFKGMIESYHAKFIEVIADGRGLTAEAVTPLADGKLYPAEEAVELGLADKVGYFEDALGQLKALAGLKKPRVVRYKQGFEFALAEFLEGRSQVDLEDLLRKAATHRTGADWMPRAEYVGPRLSD